LCADRCRAEYRHHEASHRHRRIPLPRLLARGDSGTDNAPFTRGRTVTQRPDECLLRHITVLLNPVRGRSPRSRRSAGSFSAASLNLHRRMTDAESVGPEANRISEEWDSFLALLAIFQLHAKFQPFAKSTQIAPASRQSSDQLAAIVGVIPFLEGSRVHRNLALMKRRIV
jgi:hypothetical protein